MGAEIVRANHSIIQELYDRVSLPNVHVLTEIDSAVELIQYSLDREKLGIEGDITISQTGKLQIKCTKIGSAVLKITFIAGGSNLGSDEATGGMAITREVAVLSRNFASNGGWL